jgi:CHAT domain-containing protein
VVGLSRSLFVAGASTVMVSLWQVPDRPTADLMRGFYQNWRQQGMDKAQALRQAMRQVKQVSPDPVNWAAFTLIGTAD